MSCRRRLRARDLFVENRFGAQRHGHEVRADLAHRLLDAPRTLICDNARNKSDIQPPCVHIRSTPPRHVTNRIAWRDFLALAVRVAEYYLDWSGFGLSAPAVRWAGIPSTEQPVRRQYHLSLRPCMSRSLADVVAEMRDPAPGMEYYAITLLGTTEGKMSWSAYTEFAGWVNGKPGRELRKAALVYPDRMASIWKDLGEQFLVVNTLEHLAVYLRAGGNALVEAGIAQRYLPDVLAAEATAYDGPLGFKSIRDLPRTAFNRAPTPKLWMRVIKRDRYRCRVCGRRPADYTDVEIHVHHIRPAGRGGLSEEENLITLCQTCHKGLDPHHDVELFGLIESDPWRSDLAENRRKYYEGVKLYREGVGALIKDREHANEDSPRTDPPAA